MTGPVTRIGRTTIARLPGERATLCGPLGEVSAILDDVQTTGRLLSASAPQPMPGQADTVLVTVRLSPPRRAPLPARSTPRRRRTALTGGVVLAAFAAVAALVWAVLWVLAWAAANWAVILAGLAVTILVVTAISGAAGRSGAHCPGPWHR